jgi:hypothetical protein
MGRLQYSPRCSYETQARDTGHKQYGKHDGCYDESGVRNVPTCVRVLCSVGILFKCWLECLHNLCQSAIANGACGFELFFVALSWA